MTPSAPFRILAVCTGNVCRSPMVERLLQAEFDNRSPGSFKVSSAGTHALVNHGMTSEIAELVTRHGGSDKSFVARQLTGRVLAGQDLILTLTRAHRTKVLEIAPGLLRRAFTIREFGRMVACVRLEFHDQWSTDPHERWNQLIPLAASVRHKVLVNSLEDDDVVDPYRGDQAVHREMYGQLRPALEALSGFEKDMERV